MLGLAASERVSNVMCSQFSLLGANWTNAQSYISSTRAGISLAEQIDFMVQKNIGPSKL